jgi:hypothetical protein
MAPQHLVNRIKHESCQNGQDANNRAKTELQVPFQATGPIPDRCNKMNAKPPFRPSSAADFRQENSVLGVASDTAR